MNGVCGGAAQRTLDGTKDKLPAEKTAAIRDQIGKLRSAIDKQDAAAIKTGTGALEKLVHEIPHASESAADSGSPQGR